jgi:large subunit ribosomal protein L18
MGSKRSTNARLRDRRRLRIRKKVTGTPDRPRLSVYRSLKHIQAQLIDDVAGRSLMGLSSDSPEVRGLDAKGKCDASREVGRLLATKAVGEGITQVE